MLIAKEGTIIAGHARILAARTDLQDIGFDLSPTGFDDDELKDLVSGGDNEPSDGLTHEDDIPEAPTRPITRRGDLWLLGKNRLLCGDSTSPEDVTGLMNGERAQLFATDPPYLVDYDGTNHPTNMKDSKRRNRIRIKDWSEEYVEQKHWDDSSRDTQRVAIDHAIDDVALYCWHASRRHSTRSSQWRS